MSNEETIKKMKEEMHIRYEQGDQNVVGVVLDDEYEIFDGLLADLVIMQLTEDILRSMIDHNRKREFKNVDAYIFNDEGKIVKFDYRKLGKVLKPINIKDGLER